MGHVPHQIHDKSLIYVQIIVMIIIIIIMFVSYISLCSLCASDSSEVRQTDVVLILNVTGLHPFAYANKT